MGLNATSINARFDTIIPGLAAGKYDIGMSSFTDTKEREQTVDFVTYFRPARRSSSRPAGVTSTPSPTCAASRWAWRRARPSSTTPPRRARSAPTRARQRSTSGLPRPDGATWRCPAAASTSAWPTPVVDYQVKQSSGKFEVTGSLRTAPYGIAIPKTTGMTPPVLAAIKNLIASGTYNILTKWGVQDGAITTR